MHPALRGIRDGWYEPSASPGALERWARRRLIRDPRDWPFIRLSLLMSAVVLPLAGALFVPGVFRWWMAPLYWALLFGVFVGPYILMLHCISHRPLFRQEVRWLHYYIVWVLGPFMGETPETYAAHHIGMHHPENNLEGDLSSTMAYQRDSFRHWLVYWARFFFLAIFELSGYLLGKKRRKKFRRMLLGELSFYAVVALLAIFVSWPATFTVFVVPFVGVRILMMCGNWGQHAFIDPADPGNCYTNSITCVNVSYNRKCFNDGYHIVHHIKPAMHWTLMPGELIKNWTRYRDERAIIFEGIDFFQVWVFLMLRRYDWLAARMITLDEEPWSTEDKIALMRSRLRPIHRTPEQRAARPDPVASAEAVGA